MTTKSEQISWGRWQNPSQQRDYGHLAELQTGCGRTTSECRQVVLECTSDLLHQPVCAKTPQNRRHSARIHPKARLKIPIAETRYVVSTLNDRSKDVQIRTGKKIETAKTPAVSTHRARHPVQIMKYVRWIVNHRDEVQVAPVRRQQQAAQIHDAVYRFSYGRDLTRDGSVPVFHLPVVLEKGDIVGRRLNPQHDPVLVIHLYCYPAHMMLDACALDSGRKIVADLVFIATVRFAAKKRGYLIRLDTVNGSPGEILVKVLEILLPAEYEIRCVFDLHQAPVVGNKLLDHGAVCSRGPVDNPMDFLRFEPVGQNLSRIPVVALHEGVVEQTVTDALFVKHCGQSVMPVEVELQSKGRPRRHTQVAQSKLRLNKIEVIMQALGCRIFEERTVGLFIVPRLVSGASLHGRKNVYQPGVLATLAQYFPYLFLLAEIVLSDKFYIESSLGGESFGVLPDLVSKRFCPFGVIKDPNAIGIQVTCHTLGETNTWNGSGDNNAVEAGKYTLDLVGVSLKKQIHNRPHA